MNISYDAYRVFYFVAQYHSFTKAAQMLYSNQPNVTRTIRNLEQALGCSLFVRSNRGAELTPEGERLYTHIAAAMEQIQAGEQELHADVSLKKGIISIGTTEIAMHCTLLSVLERFRMKYPGIRFRIFNYTTTQAIAALRDRMVELALVTTPFDLPDGIIRKDLAEFQEVPVCGNAYEALTGQVLSLKQLRQYPLISLNKGTATYRLYSDWFYRNGISLSLDIEAATADQILPLVRSNLGIGFIPEHSAKQAVHDGGVSILKLREPLPERKVCLLKHKDISLAAAARELERMIVQTR